MIAPLDLDRTAVIGVSGHAGAGHVHSHSGFIQDDCAGFAVTAALLRQAYPVDTTVTSVAVEAGRFIVATAAGGSGSASARRGITVYEAELAQRCVGKDAILSQPLALQCFGRIYGQGVQEPAVALQTALCLAVIDSFLQHFPDHFVHGEEGIAGNVGGCLGAKLVVDGIGLAVMSVLNATAGGIGPVEDLEGNICLAAKGRTMKRLGLEALPTMVVESKAYVPHLSSRLDRNTFLVRYHQEHDNPAVGQALLQAAAALGRTVLDSDSAYTRNSDEMAQATESLGERVMALGRRLQAAEGAVEKAALVAELALLVSQDAGGITYMSREFHQRFAGGGLWPGTAAVLSLVVCQEYLDRQLLPELDHHDVAAYLDLLLAAIPYLFRDIETARGFLDRAREVDAELLESLLSGAGAGACD